MGADNGRVVGCQIRVTQAQLFRLIATQVVGQSVRRGHQLVKYSPAVRVFQIQAERAFVAIEGLEKLAVVVAQVIGPHRPGHIAPRLPVFDLDQIRAQVGQKARTVGPRAVMFDGDDP